MEFNLNRLLLFKLILYHAVFASSMAPKYIYVGYEAYVEVLAIWVVDIYIDLVAYTAIYFE